MMITKKVSFTEISVKTEIVCYEYYRNACWFNIIWYAKKVIGKFFLWGIK